MTENIPINRWAHLKFLGKYHRPIMALDHHGNEYVADTHGPVYMQFRCDCGHDFALPIDDFPGRRRLKSCGRAECPFANPAKPAKPFRDRGAAFSVYLSQDMAQRVREHSRAKGQSFSAVIETGMREFFLRQLMEE